MQCPKGREGVDYQISRGKNYLAPERTGQNKNMECLTTSTDAFPDSTLFRTSPQNLEPAEGMQERADVAPAQETEEGEAEEETYLVPVGYGCFSFQRGLLHRALPEVSSKPWGLPMMR